MLPPTTAVKRNVKGQEAKIVKVKSQAWFLKESRVKGHADSIVYKIIHKQANVPTVLDGTVSWIQIMASFAGLT